MTMGTQEAAESRTESGDAEADTSGARRPRAVRTGALAAALALALCAGFVLYGILSDEDPKPRPKVPTAAVTYEVTGEGRADISYQGASENGTATTVSRAELPWRKTVRVPLGRTPLVGITLGEGGGRATCALAIRGRHVQSATATGAFGRASCSGTLPSPQPGEG